jgi:hypothetical protein
VSRCYLYGRGEPAVFSLMKDPAFTRLLRGLYAGGVALPAQEDERETAARAVDAGLLQGNGSGYTPGPRLVVIPRHAVQDAARRMSPALDRYAEIAAAAAPELRDAYERTAAAAAFAWDRAEHTLMAGMLLDLSVGSRLWLDGHIRRGYDETLVWAFEETPGLNAFGVQWVAAEGETAGLAQLWHRGVQRTDLRISPPAVRELARLALGDDPPPSGKERLLLRYLGFTETAEGGERSRVPAFSAAEMDELLLPVLWRSAGRLVAEGVLPALEAGRAAPWWSPRAGSDSVHHALVRTVLELGTDRVVDTGGIAPFPTGTAGTEWGRWVWAERPGPRTLVAGAFEGAMAG